MGVEGGTGVAVPQRPDPLGAHPVPDLRAEVQHGLQKTGLLVAVALGEAATVAAVSVLVQGGQRLGPGLGVGRQVGVVPAVGLQLGQPRVDHLQHRHAGLLVLVEDQVQQRPGHGLLGRREVADRRRWPDPSQDDPGRDRVPGVGLAQHVEALETRLVPPGGGPAARQSGPHQSLRRRIEASRPMPPTMVISSGANSGGPISRLYLALRHPPGFWLTPRACR